MWKALKRRILRAAFTDFADRDFAWTASFEAAERLAATGITPVDAEKGEVSYSVCMAIFGAIERYQELRAGPLPEPPGPPIEPNTPRRPIRERGRRFLTCLVNRVRMAFRVLVLGHRPATVRFDAIDRRIARNCAFWKADDIAARFVPTRETIDEDDDVWREIAAMVNEAIEAYVTYSVELERRCEVNQALEEERFGAKGGGAL